MIRWQRLIVLALFGLTFFVGSRVAQRLELPLMPVAQADEANAAEDRTETLELRFDAGSSALDAPSEARLQNFLRTLEQKERVAAYKVMVWAAPTERALAVARTETLRHLVEGSVPASFVIFAEKDRGATPPAERAKAAVLAVLE